MHEQVYYAFPYSPPCLNDNQKCTESKPDVEPLNHICSGHIYTGYDGKAERAPRIERTIYFQATLEMIRYMLAIGLLDLQIPQILYTNFS